MSTTHQQATAHHTSTVRDLERLGAVLVRLPGLDIGCYSEQMGRSRSFVGYRLMALLRLGYVNRDRARDCDDDWLPGHTWIWYLTEQGEAWAHG